MLVKPLWSEIELLIAANVGKTLKLKANHVILGITHSERFSKTDLKHINLMLLVGKLCISKYKYVRGLFTPTGHSFQDTDIWIILFYPKY